MNSSRMNWTFASDAYQTSVSTEKTSNIQKALPSNCYFLLFVSEDGREGPHGGAHSLETGYVLTLGIKLPNFYCGMKLVQRAAFYFLPLYI